MTDTAGDSQLDARIRAALERAAPDGLTLDELAWQVGGDAPKKELRRALRELLRTGGAVRLDADVFCAGTGGREQVGLLMPERRGYRLLPDDSTATSVEIPVEQAAGAIGGDRVRVRVLQDNGRGRAWGEVLDVVAPIARQARVRVARAGKRWTAIWPGSGEPVRLDPPEDVSLTTGALVTVRIIGRDVARGEGARSSWELLGELVGPDAGRSGVGRSERSVPRDAAGRTDGAGRRGPGGRMPGGPAPVELWSGRRRGAVDAKEAFRLIPDDERNARTLLDALAKGLGVDDPFPPEVVAEADAAREPEGLADGDRDLLEFPLITIDPEDAKDFDDAVWAKPTRTGHRLLVAVADVSAYVAADGALDREAMRRGCSVYLPGRVYPMLPEALSNGVCSLRPGELRRCAWVELDLDRTGAVIRYDAGFGVMKSRARLTYAQAQAMLDGTEPPPTVAIGRSLQALDQVRERLHARRRARGMLDLDLPEPAIALTDDDRNVAQVEPYPRLRAHRLIEECMLAANETVANLLSSRGWPAIYRAHGEPDEAKLKKVVSVARAMGIDVASRGVPTVDELGRLIERFESEPRGRILSYLVLRSMPAASYTIEDTSHYGIGAERYLHFTSPIRRYPDLAVHRLLRLALASARRPEDALVRAMHARLKEAVAASNEGEKVAAQAERWADRLLRALYMVDRVGESFDAVIADVQPFGVFVSVTSPYVEGLVPVRALGAGYLTYDEPNRELRSRDGSARFGLGDPLRVRCTGVSVGEGRITFAPAALEGTRRGALRGRRVRRGD